MKKILLIDPFSGASGDMLLAALIDAGAPLAVIRERVLSIPELSKARIDVEQVMQGFFAAKRLVIDLPDAHSHRGLGDVTRIIDAAGSLSDRVKSRSRETFTRLAMAEARVHGTTVEEVHFHEVGALDAILDIVGFHVASEALDVDVFAYTQLVLGGGTTMSDHGEIPIPAPATLELLDGHRVSFSGRSQELVTPTAAAIIATVFRPVGADERIVSGKVGYGAGTRESEGLPNILRVSVGEIEEAPRSVAVIRCTIDDMNPEVYGHVMQSLFAAGALETYFQPVMMKKNRPGIEITVITEERDANKISNHLLAETTTLGVRVAREERVELERRQERIETELGPALVKVATLPDGSEKASPEFESCREISHSTGTPILDVFDIVRRAWLDRE